MPVEEPKPKRLEMISAHLKAIGERAPYLQKSILRAYAEKHLDLKEITAIRRALEEPAVPEPAARERLEVLGAHLKVIREKSPDLAKSLFQSYSKRHLSLGHISAIRRALQEARAA